MRSGLSAQQAFEAAVQGIGQAAVLECEFDKVGVTKQAQARAKHAILTLAGIPNHYLNPPMNTPPSNREPGWATYLKAAASLVPAVFLWAVSVVFVMPKLKQICGEAGGLALPAIIRIMIGLAEHGIIIAGAIILILILLEWRSSKWPRYRRAAVGIGAFFINSVVLISMFMTVVTALLVVPALLHHPK
jgi:hypothetical protein